MDTIYPSDARSAPDGLRRRDTAKRYVLVDDKLRILSAVKSTWGDRVTTVFVRQGRYARDPQALTTYPPADLQVEHIAELATHDRSSFDAQRG